MDNIMETLSITFSLVALFIPFALFTIIYLIKRNGLYVSANCWFCNTWTRVLYSNRNSFYCPSCQQYNGFDKDGGYNKVIEAQYDTSFNKYNKTIRKTELLTNGLCTYCNNNQQLKVYQLAHFVPLNENNYDVEVDHFRMQLEKAYKLCKKCNQVLKTTIEKQHAWIFGNRLKSFRKKGLSLLNNNKYSQIGYTQVQQSFFINIVRYLLILLSIFILCHTLNVKINCGDGEVEKYVPDSLVPYTMLLSDLYNNVTSASRNITKGIHKLNSHLPNNVKLKADNILPLISVGLLLEFVLLIGGRQAFWWKVNETLAWMILVFSSSVSFQDRYSMYIKTLQVFCSIAIICSLTSTNSKRKQKLPRKLEFKKLGKYIDDSDSSDIDEEVSGETSNSSMSSKKSNIGNPFKGNGPNATFYQLPHTFSRGSKFQNNTQNAFDLNNSFATARSTKSTSVFNSSFKDASNKSCSSELHRSLDNLHLSNLNFKPQPVFSDNLVNRPILSPPKLKNVTQNSWTAGGFWKNDSTLYPASTEFVHLSRSSSQSSGFVSNNEPPNLNRFSSLPSSREPSICGDIDRSSILSEPAYHFKPIHSSRSKTSQSKNSFDYDSLQSPKIASSPNSGQLYYKAENNTFYPLLNQNNMLVIQGANIPRHNFESSFSNLSLRSFNINNSNFNSPILFGERPVISSLFKNLPEFSEQSHYFKAPRC